MLVKAVGERRGTWKNEARGSKLGGHGLAKVANQQLAHRRWPKGASQALRAAQDQSTRRNKKWECDCCTISRKLPSPCCV